jgi:MerR family transcriptional regulator, copper efflux regulator
MSLTTSELARRAGVNTETIRYYERRKLLPTPPRTAAGYRQYDAGSVDRIRFIKRAQELGFSLEEIDELLALRADESASTEDVREKSRAKIADIETRIRDLGRMKAELERLVRACSGDAPASECSILRALSEAD